eukprot:m.372675 g.372675  ORF g.372675 m.372675 type:complete len:102 (-) comp28150_c0_seq6:21-326(-)
MAPALPTLPLLPQGWSSGGRAGCAVPSSELGSSEPTSPTKIDRNICAALHVLPRWPSSLELQAVVMAISCTPTPHNVLMRGAEVPSSVALAKYSGAIMQCQ